MDLIESVKQNFFNVMKFYDFKCKNDDINSINTKNLQFEIILFKSKSVIKNTEYELLISIKNIIEEIQKYGDVNNYIKLDESIKQLTNYNSNKSSNKNHNFLDIISLISSSSKESIVNSDVFNEFNEYLHVKRPIENILENSLIDLKSHEQGLIFLVGSVGDGKSHLLSYFNKNKSDLLSDVFIYNDATESNSPYKTAIDTLAEYLQKYKEGTINKLIIAINIGMLNNLREYLKQNNLSIDVLNTIQESNIFSNNGMDKVEFKKNKISIISFLYNNNLKIENGNISNEFFENIFQKVFNPSLSNPFYKSFIEDDGENRQEPIYQNYQLLLDEEVQNSLIHLLIKIQIENKRIITTRALLNFIYDIIVPEISTKENDKFLVNLLFKSIDRSPILSSISFQDPILLQDYNLDKLNIEIYNSFNLREKCKNLFGINNFVKIEKYLLLLQGLNHKRKFEMIVRLHYLFNHKSYESNIFFEFIDLIENINSEKNLQKSLLKCLMTTIYKWNGSPLDGYIYNESLKPDTSIRIGLQFKPKIKNIHSNDDLTISVSIEIQQQTHTINIDYNLYKLIRKIENGYILKEKDKIESVLFSEFIDNILNNLISLEKTIINIPNTKEIYIISEEFLGYQIKELNNGKW